jgi:hypothetical protein
VVTATDGNGHTGKSIAINVTSASPTSTPSPTPTPTSAFQATLNNGATIILPIVGNITTTQISNTTITTNQTAHTTTVAFTVTGQSGTTGFCNITIPKTQVAYGTTPAVTIDCQQVQNQGFVEDGPNYYVGYSIHFSTHQVEILFTENQTPTGTADPFFAVEIAGLVIALILAGALAIVVSRRQKRKKSKDAQK